MGAAARSTQSRESAAGNPGRDVSNDLEDDALYVPGTNERADLSLDYRNVPVLPSKRPEADADYSWPAPRLALWPFDRLVDYIRPLGPGVLVGRGYRHTAGDDTSTTSTRALIL